MLWIENPKMHRRNWKHRNIGKTNYRAEIKKQFYKLKLYWIFDCLSFFFVCFIAFCSSPFFFDQSVLCKIRISHYVDQTITKTHKKDSSETFCIFCFSPIRSPFRLLLINIVFENFVYSVTICFNGEKVFYPFPQRHLRAFFCSLISTKWILRDDHAKCAFWKLSKRL